MLDRFSVGLVAACIFLQFVPATADQLNEQARALETITNNAEKICNVISTKKKLDSLEVKGEIQAQLNQLLAKFASAGLSGSAANIESEEQRTVLEADLAASLSDNAKCKLRFFEDLKSLVVKEKAEAPTRPTTPPSPCRSVGVLEFGKNSTWNNLTVVGADCGVIDGGESNKFNSSKVYQDPRSAPNP